MPGQRVYFLLPLLTACLSACAELPVIEEDRCGNGFIEAGEDCDVLGVTAKGPGNTATCNAPGTVDQCRFHCTSDAQCQASPVVAGVELAPDGPTPGAPVKAGSGWRCGTDHVCRRPRGIAGGNGAFFEPVSTLVPGAAAELFTGDFDGDGRKEVLAMGQTGFDVHYFTPDGHEAKSVSVPGSPVVPGIGKLTTTGADDFTLDVGRGIGVMLGGVGQTIDPTSYLSLDATKRYPGEPPDDMRLLIVDTGKGPTPFALGNLKNFVQLIDAAADPNGDKNNVFLEVKEGYGRKKLLGTIPVAFLRPLGDRQRFLLAYKGEDAVAVVDILPKPMPPAPPPMPPVIAGPIALPPGFTIHGPAFFADVNLDGLTDVLVGMAKCTPGIGDNNPEVCTLGELGVAYGDGDGAFYATPKSGSPPDWNPAVKGQAAESVKVYPNDGPMKGAVPAAEIEPLLPIAVGHINLDGQIDYVNTHGIYVSNGSLALDCNNAPNDYCRAEEPSSGDSWSEAKILDLNANGRADVVGISAGSRGIDFFNGTSTGVFNTFFLPTEGAPSNLAAGDFDGDLVGDLAYDSVTGKVGKVDGQPALVEVHTLFVAFGQTSGAPELPVSMGEVPGLLQLVAGSLPFLGNDAASDLVAVSGVRATWKAEGTKQEARLTEGRDWKVGLSLGNAYRQLQEPLAFFSRGSIAINSLPLASAIGLFDGDTSAPPKTASHPDLAAIVLHRTGGAELRDPPSATPFCDFAAAVWMLSVTGEAVIEPPSDTSLNLDIPDLTTMVGTAEKFLPIRRLVEAVPIDTDRRGPEELLITFPSYDTCDKDLSKMGAHGELLLATFDAKGQPTVKQILSTVGPNQSLLHVRVGDLDGDGKIDIVAMKPTFDFNGPVQLLSSSIVVMRGKGDGAFEDPIEVPIAGFPIDIALVNAEGDSDLEIVVVSELATADFAPALFVIDWDKSPPDPRVPFKTLLPRSEASSTASSALEGPTALAGGDFDGDGVDDVAVAVAGGVRLFKGVAR